MRTLICALALALLSGAGVQAQDASRIREPEILIPSFDRDTEVIMFRLHGFWADMADVPFFVDRTGIVIRKDDVERVLALVEESVEFRFPAVALFCAPPEDASLDLTRPEDRRRYCTLRSPGPRQP